MHVIESCCKCETSNGYIPSSSVCVWCVTESNRIQEPQRTLLFFFHFLCDFAFINFSLISILKLTKTIHKPIQTLTCPQSLVWLESRGVKLWFEFSGFSTKSLVESKNEMAECGAELRAPIIGVNYDFCCIRTKTIFKSQYCENL